MKLTNAASMTVLDREVLDDCPNGRWFDPHAIQRPGHRFTGNGAYPRAPRYRCNRLVDHGLLKRRVHPDFERWLGAGPRYALRWQYRLLPPSERKAAE